MIPLRRHVARTADTGALIAPVVAAADSAALMLDERGMICDCDGDTDNPKHGTTEEPCPNAHCYHCGWEGEFPTGMVQCPTCKGIGKIRKKAKQKSK